MRHTRGISILGALVLGCATATQKAYVAPTGETIVSETEERQSDPPVHTIFVQNRSTVPVTVFSVALNGCTNVKQNCGPRPTNLRVHPGQRIVVARVEPQTLRQGFSYSFGFSWRADSSSTAALSAIAAAGAPGAREWTRDDYSRLGSRIAALRAEPESLLLAPGERVNIEQVRILVVDSAGATLGYTRWISWRVGVGVQFLPPNEILALRRTSTFVTYRLSPDAEGLMGKTIAELAQPVVVAYRSEPGAPVFTGRALDADTRVPLRCAGVALEDNAANVVNSQRSDSSGRFRLSAPRAGTYRVRVETHGWVPAYGRSELAQSGETKEDDYLVRFTEQLLITRDRREITEFQHASPAAVTSGPIGPRPGTRTGQTTAIVPGVTLGGSESMPILGIISSRNPAMTTWMQFVVDPDGRVDTTSLVLPPGVSANARNTIVSVLPRVRFSPARDSGNPVCELLRMQVNFSPR